MKNLEIKLTKTILGILGIALSSQMAHAEIQMESSYELMCRAKAKELAADTYRNCVTESRNSEIEKLKKDYQERLRSLKEDYEKEIDKIGGKKSAKKPGPAPKMLAASMDHKKSLSVNADTITVDTRNMAKDSLPDESRMDLPEPIPVENFDRN